MAKARSKSRAKGAPPKRTAAPANRLLIVLTVLALVPFSLPTLIILFCGMLPTIMAVFGERRGGRYAWICVGGLNFSGLTPWLFDLWFGHHTLSFAFDQLTNITMLLTAYGAAVGGWMLYLGTPPIVGLVMSITSRNRAVSLISEQRKIVDLWGDTVVSRDSESG
jgi:hypothetical protein